MMNNVASKAIRARSSLALAQRRQFSSSSPNVITRRKKRAPGATPTTTSTQPRTAPTARIPPLEEPLEKLEMTPEIHRNNFLLATALLAFCASVTWYSMSAVGQAGSPGGGQADPLAGLKQEAEAAQHKKIAESQTLAETQEMLAQAQSGAYDPDRAIDEMEREEIELEKQQQQQQKKAWWKFW